MRNSANEAKRMWLETYHIKDYVDYIAMDSKADEASLFSKFKRKPKMNLIASCRATKCKTAPRRKMTASINTENALIRLSRCKVWRRILFSN
jgi:hypothetical protein